MYKYTGSVLGIKHVNQIRAAILTHVLNQTRIAIEMKAAPRIMTILRDKLIRYLMLWNSAIGSRNFPSTLTDCRFDRDRISLQERKCYKNDRH